jgi:hypothetical protein
VTAYRSNADPRKVEELFTLSISTAKGRELVGVIGALSIVFWVALAVTIFSGAPPEIEAWAWTMPTLGVIFGAIAYGVHLRRRRALSIRRVGDAIELVIFRENVTLEFPLTPHGSQSTVHVRGAPMYEVYLQLVGKNRQAITLHETRGTIHGPQNGWYPNDIDRSLASPLFDVSGAGTLAKIIARIEELSHERT